MSRYYDDTLCHHGRKGQHWGARNGPPYPLNAGGLAKFRKKLKAYKDGAEDRKTKKAQKKADKVEAKAAKKQADHEKRLEELSKSPTYLWKHKDAYTTEELNQALNRINTEQRIHEASMKELKRGKDVCDTIIGYGKTINDAYKTLNNMSNNYKSFKSGNFGNKQIKDGDGDNKNDSGSENNTSNTNDTSAPSSNSSSSGSNKTVDFAKKVGKKAAAKGQEAYKKRKERYNTSRSKYPGSVDPRMFRF